MPRLSKCAQALRAARRGAGSCQCVSRSVSPAVTVPTFTDPAWNAISGRRPAAVGNNPVRTQQLARVCPSADTDMDVVDELEDVEC